MNDRAARCLMTLATLSLGQRKSVWARAMRAEFQEAAEDGRSLPFALGCLIGAWRELPRHQEGRLLLASYAVVVCLILPMAAISLTGALGGFATLGIGRSGSGGLLSGDAMSIGMNGGNVALLPSLALIVLTLAVDSLLLAWLLLDRDWVRAAALVRLGAAATATLIVFTLTSALTVTDTILPVLCLFTQSLAVAAMAHWHAQIGGDGGGREAPA